ncbi:hypothetical protein TorRG33x02_349300 [Trema orientale]|uniref:RNase H type-1 domain-containing protein n=1 Tax=Trema orientale TaxID=63057 RepID=A0A2P5AIR1_TREOI|nr:hypothetical protein TorRG33x02_349300 [Trema orientale]
MGVVARNYRGNILSTQVYRGSSASVESGEAYAMLKGVELGVSRKWPRVIFEGNCQNVIKAFEGQTNILSWDAQVYVDAAGLLMPKFHFPSFVWIPRITNGAAHHACR